jgi:hypothetical protein
MRYLYNKGKTLRTFVFYQRYLRTRSIILTSQRATRVLGSADPKSILKVARFGTVFFYRGGRHMLDRRWLLVIAVFPNLCVSHAKGRR